MTKYPEHEHIFKSDGGPCTVCGKTLCQLQMDYRHEQHMAELAEWKISGCGNPTGYLRYANGKLQQQFKTEWQRWDGSTWCRQTRLTWEPVCDVMIDGSEPAFEVRP